MKIKQIAALIKKRKCVTLYQGEGEQWVSDGAAMYSLAGLPELRLSELFRMMDIPEDKAADFQQREVGVMPGDICTEDYMDGQESLELQDFTFCRLGYELAVLVKEQQRGFLLQSRYLKPFEDVEALEFCLRESPKGKSYITVHDGMFTVAVLLPFDDAGGALGAYIGDLGAKLRAGRGGEADG